MKKVFLLLISVIVLTSLMNKASAITFEEAYKNATAKPIYLYITAPWVDNLATYDSVYKEAEKNLSKQYNVVRLDITTDEFKLFNETFHLYPKLPYVLLFRNGVKISRYLQKDCINSYSCVENKAMMFLH